MFDFFLRQTFLRIWYEILQKTESPSIHLQKILKHVKKREKIDVTIKVKMNEKLDWGVTIKNRRIMITLLIIEILIFIIIIMTQQ